MPSTSRVNGPWLWALLVFLVLAGLALAAPPRPARPGPLVQLGGTPLHYPTALAVHFPADGKTILAGGWHEIREWDLRTKKLLRRYRDDKWHAWDFTSTADGRHLVVRDFEGDILLLSRPGIAFDPALGPGSEPDGKTRVVLWDLATGRRVRLLGPEGYHTPSFAFSPDGDLLAVGALQAEDTVIVEVKTGAIRQRVAAKGGLPLAFTPDGKRLLAGPGYYDLKTGRRLFELPVEPAAQAVFRDSKRVAIVDGRDGSAAVWDLTSSSSVMGKGTLAPGHVG